MITVEQLRNNLLTMKGSAIVTINAETVPAMRKTGNPYANAVKVSAVNGIINWVYETAVNRQRTREDLEADFRAYPRKWGNRIVGAPLVEHKGNYYLEMKVQSARATYLVGNTEVSHNDITPYLRPLSKSRQGVTREVILRDYALENIKSILYAGELVEVC
jgi:hypothetical protein